MKLVWLVQLPHQTPRSARNIVERKTKHLLSTTGERSLFTRSRVLHGYCDRSFCYSSTLPGAHNSLFRSLSRRSELIVLFLIESSDVSYSFSEMVSFCYFAHHTFDVRTRLLKFVRSDGMGRGAHRRGFFLSSSKSISPSSTVFFRNDKQFPLSMKWFDRGPSSEGDLGAYSLMAIFRPLGRRS